MLSISHTYVCSTVDCNCPHLDNHEGLSKGTYVTGYVVAMLHVQLQCTDVNQSINLHEHVPNGGVVPIHTMHSTVP